METADPTKQLQDAMRRDTDSHLVCERCGAPVQYGWVYQFGSIVLATCAKASCRPPHPWVIGCQFVKRRKARSTATTKESRR